MKIIGSVKEDLTVEKRISISPETAKKLINLNFSVMLEKTMANTLVLPMKNIKVAELYCKILLSKF